MLVGVHKTYSNAVTTLRLIEVGTSFSGMEMRAKLALLEENLWIIEANLLPSNSYLFSCWLGDRKFSLYYDAINYYSVKCI